MDWMLRLCPPSSMSEALLLRCSQCDEPCVGDDIVCSSCSERRLRAVEDADAESSVRRTLGGHGLDAALATVERRSGEKVRSFELEIHAVLGGAGRLVVRAQLAADGPRTPIEDVWEGPELLVEESDVGPDERAARLEWVRRISAERRLDPPRIVERYRLEASPTSRRLTVDSVPLLLAARLKSATLFLEGFELAGVSVERAGPLAACVARFRHPLGRELTVELLAVEDGAIQRELDRFAQQGIPPT